MSASTLLLAFSTALAQTATKTATPAATTGGLPAAGNVTLTVIVVTIAVLLIVAGAVKFFQSFR